MFLFFFLFRYLCVYHMCLWYISHVYAEAGSLLLWMKLLSHRKWAAVPCYNARGPMFISSAAEHCTGVLRLWNLLAPWRLLCPSPIPLGGDMETQSYSGSCHRFPGLLDFGWFPMKILIYLFISSCFSKLPGRHETCFQIHVSKCLSSGTQDAIPFSLPRSVGTNSTL